VAHYRKALAILLLVSAILRIGIALEGGQLFWPDENRFTESQEAAGALKDRRFDEATKVLFSHSDHVLFKVIGVIPAFGMSIVSGAPAWLPSIFFGLFSVGSIYMVWRISLRVSGDPEEAFLSATVAASCSCLFYFSRHYFPYDMSLCFALLGLYSGLRARKGFLAGIWCSLAFLTYNGYWSLCAVILGVATLYRTESFAASGRRAAYALLGLAIPVLVVAGFERAAGTNYFKDVIQFSGTITMGDYHEGWKFIARYLWQSEKGIEPIVALLFALALVLGFSRRRRHLLWWVASCAVLYLGLSWMCAGLQKFVLYGRVARSVVPFFALAAGGSLAAIGQASRAGRFAQVGLVALIVLLAGVNFTPILSQQFPDEFRLAAQRAAERLPLEERVGARILNAFQYPWSEAFHYQAIFAPVPDRYRTILKARHPLEYRPFQYEGYSPDQRDLFDANDITMRLIVLEGPGATLSVPPDPSMEGYLGALRIEATLPPKEFGLGEPLVTTGKTGHGDFFYVLCTPSAGTIRLGVDHWGYGGTVTKPIAVDYGKPHRFEVSMGSLLPPKDSALYTRRPELAAYLHRMVVSLDGRVVMDEEATFNPSLASDVNVGSNFLWGSTVRPNFTGTILRVESINPAGIR